MKTLIRAAVIILAAMLFYACSKNELIEERIPPGDPFEIPAWDYSTSHYWVDTSYIPFYEMFYLSEPPTITPAMQQAQIIEEEVWVELVGAFNENSYNAVSYISLSPRGNGYDSSFRNSSSIPGSIEGSRMVRLRSWEYTLMADGYLGIVGLDKPILGQQIIGAAYRRADGQQFGEFLRDVPRDSAGVPARLILKMVKPRNLTYNGRNYPVAWNQLVKSIYSLNMHQVEKRDFVLDVLRVVPGSGSVTTIIGFHLLQVLSLDRFDSEGAPRPDTRFDFRPQRTIDQERGLIIFPQVRPFDKGIQRYFAQQGISINDTNEYLFRGMYDTTKTFSQQDELRNRYVIKGRAFHN